MRPPNRKHEPPSEPTPKTKPANIKAWLDFWVICGDTKAHLFFTSLNGKMWADVEEKGKPSKWLTYFGLSVLNASSAGENQPSA